MPVIGRPAQHYDDVGFRIWPDGTIQDVEADAPTYMSDDYVIVWAPSESAALEWARSTGVC